MSNSSVSIVPTAPRLDKTPGHIDVMTKSVSPEGQRNPPSKETPRIITCKKWVLPPRPKPGRKPSVETPASKRKAQNRAAQRAFRERRASRAQELEEKLEEVEKIRDYREMEYVNRINHLTTENKNLTSLVEKHKMEVTQIKKNAWGTNMTDQGTTRRFSRNASHTSWHSAESTSQRSSQSSDNGSENSGEKSSVSSSAAIQQVSPATSTQSSPQTSGSGSLTSQSDGENHYSNSVSDSISNKLECGICMKDNCVCESIGIKEEVLVLKKLHETIENYVPTESVSLGNRKRKADYGDREIDFTKKFAKSKLPEFKRSNTSLVSANSSHLTASVPEIESYPEDRCGFCTDDTFCLCKEAQMDSGKRNSSEGNGSLGETGNALPPIQNKSSKVHPLPVMHPGPSVDISNITNLSPGAVPTVITQTDRLSTVTETGESPSKKETSTCTGNPGTCEQCMKDPMSNLFCTTIASREKQDKSHEQEPRETNIADKNKSDSTPKSESLFIPCADAYRTLSLHKKFNSVDFGSLVGKLTTRGMQVEVQSVADVIRQLDRRLYN